MLNHGYTVKLVDDEAIVQNLNDIKKALDTIVNALAYPVSISFVTVGRNGTGSVPLVPPKLANATTPLYRALAGFRLVAALDLTSNSSLQTSFEQVLSANDQIKQASASDLSANRILFMFQG